MHYRLASEKLITYTFAYEHINEDKFIDQVNLSSLLTKEDVQQEYLKWLDSLNFYGSPQLTPRHCTISTEIDHQMLIGEGSSLKLAADKDPVIKFCTNEHEMYANDVYGTIAHLKDVVRTNKFLISRKDIQNLQVIIEKLESRY